MPYQIFYSSDYLFLKAKSPQHFPCSCRTFCFLRLSIRTAIFFHSDLNSNIMNKRRSFQCIHCAFIQPLSLANQPGKTVYLHKMLNMFRITLVIADHFHIKPVNSVHKSSSSRYNAAEATFFLINLPVICLL